MEVRPEPLSGRSQAVVGVVGKVVAGLGLRALFGSRLRDCPGPAQPDAVVADAPGSSDAGLEVDLPGAGVRVAVLGYGAIGRVVARELLAGAVPGARLVCVINRSSVPKLSVPQLSLAQALEAADIFVECAGPIALREVIEPVLSAGRDLVVSSVAGLMDAGLADSLAALGPGRLRCTHGALGGLDLLASAAAASGGLDRVVLRTTKKPIALVQPWMDEKEIHRVRDAEQEVLVFAGTPAEAARLFPQSLNVAAALAFAVGDADVRVELHADPGADLTTHRIEASGRQGSYMFEVRNRPSPNNLRTSAVVPYSILRTLSGLTARPPLIG